MANVTQLPPSLHGALQEVVDRTATLGVGIRAILLSTTEGVPLGRVYTGDDPLNEEVLASIESVWAPVAKQIPSLGMEKLQRVTAVYDHGILCHIYESPVVITILCGLDCNIGAVRSTAIPLLKVALDPLKRTLVESLNPGHEYYQ